MSADLVAGEFASAVVDRRYRSGGNVMIDKELLEIMACPKCKAGVRLENDKIICTNPECGLRYPIRDGIPVMLIDEAEKPGKANA
jgi:uncharacterized protein YbaR (Trm112 family)